MSEQIVYSIAGNVLASGGLYIPRKADDELLTLCRAGTFAYILAPRQVGKTSLMAYTVNRLTKENIRPVIVDLNQIGVQVTAEEWYLGQLVVMQDKLELHTDVIEWWHSQAHLSLVQRLILFYRTQN